jgi:hypothetical protein
VAGADPGHRADVGRRARGADLDDDLARHRGGLFRTRRDGEHAGLGSSSGMAARAALGGHVRHRRADRIVGVALRIE